MAEEKFSNFLTDIIDADLAEGKVDVVHTRFPPEPNGYLHIGSAKAIYINYMTAKTYGGKFNLRFDDTNPAREGDEYVQSILQIWNGWVPPPTAAFTTAAITLKSAMNTPKSSFTKAKPMWMT